MRRTKTRRGESRRERVHSSVRARCAIIGDKVVATKRRGREGDDADAADAGLVEELGEK